MNTAPSHLPRIEDPMPRHAMPVRRRGAAVLYVLAILLTGAATVGVMLLLANIKTRK